MERSPLQKLATFVVRHPELRDELMPVIREAMQARKEITGPPTTTIYEHKIDHGYNEPLAGGTDVMKRLQDKFLIEQGRPPREKNPKIATKVDDPTLLMKRAFIESFKGGRLGRSKLRTVVNNLTAMYDNVRIADQAKAIGDLQRDGLVTTDPGGLTWVASSTPDAVLRGMPTPRITQSPQLAASVSFQRDLIALLTGAEGQRVAREMVTRYAADTNTTVVVNAAAEDIINEAVAVALDPRRMGAVIARHTVQGE